MNCDGLVYQKELYGGYEETWMIRSADGDHYLYQESYGEDLMNSVTVFRVTSDEIAEVGKQRKNRRRRNSGCECIPVG